MKGSRCWTAASCTLAFTAVAFTSGLGAGEELLHKPAAKYLGWQTGNGKFTTCAKTVLDVGDGRIEKTDEKCRKPGGSGPLTKTTGTITYVNAANRTLGVEDAKGQAHDVYVPEDARMKGWFLWQLRPGEKVAVIGPVPGRAESVEKIQ